MHVAFLVAEHALTPVPPEVPGWHTAQAVQVAAFEIVEKFAPATQVLHAVLLEVEHAALM